MPGQQCARGRLGGGRAAHAGGGLTPRGGPGGAGAASARAAAAAADYDGWCTSVSVQLGEVALPFFDMYTRCCTVHTGRAHVRPAIPRVLELVAAGRFDPTPVTTSTARWDDAIDALLETPLKLVAVR
ncbi:hypothetical protein [Nocardia farcinica]|uniref:hypothetical protein n=1 Tax=Nocardia farcinica TaxID=37329 RepID=UPI002455D146|nr:hypothetical protein [Nocardia farcinica]